MNSRRRARVACLGGVSGASHEALRGATCPTPLARSSESSEHEVWQVQLEARARHLPALATRLLPQRALHELKRTLHRAGELVGRLRARVADCQGRNVTWV
jgi:hypothetical protein